MVGVPDMASSDLYSGLVALGINPQLAALTFDPQEMGATPGNPYLPWGGFLPPTQPQWTEATTTITTSSNLPDIQVRAHAVDHMDINEYLKSFPSAQKQPRDPNDWTAWPITVSVAAWYRRVDKVEFWASVVLIGYYVAHCVFGVA